MNLNIIAWILTAALAFAKLIGYATISWLVVFAPVLFTLTLTLILFMFAAIIALIAVTTRRSRR